MKRLTLALLFLILLIVPKGQAGCHLRPRIVYSSYHHYAPVTSYPSYAYKQHYYYDYGHEKIILLPKVVEVEVHRDHYYSIDPYYQQSLLADAIVGRLLQAQNKTAPVRTGYPSTPVTTPPSSPTKKGSQEVKAGSYQEPKLLKVINDSCVKCHGANSSNIALVTADGKLADISEGEAWKCFGLVNSGEMPKASKSLNDEQVKLFYEWAKNARK